MLSAFLIVDSRCAMTSRVLPFVSAAMLRWSKNGFDYLLALPDSGMGLRGGLMPLFVQQTEMVESKTA